MFEDESLSKNKWFILIGNIKPICPYCSCILEIKPTRKKKCPHCEQNIIVKTRPIDRESVLIKEVFLSNEKPTTLITKNHPPG
jgi:DNA-directed RNA polymerase subunit RPC12/RpoP